MFLILLYINPQDLDTLHIFLNFITFTKSSLKAQDCFGVDREVRGCLSRPQNNIFLWMGQKVWWHQSQEDAVEDRR